jgi:hypothetical protein
MGLTGAQPLRLRKQQHERQANPQRGENHVEAQRDFHLHACRGEWTHNKLLSTMQ